MGQSESNIQTNIINYLKAIGAYCFKRHSDAWSGAGGGDITCCYKGRFISIEVKEPNGSLKPHQIANLRRVQKTPSLGIGMATRSLKRVQELIKCIDAGGTGVEFNYRP